MYCKCITVSSLSYPHVRVSLSIVENVDEYFRLRMECKFFTANRAFTRKLSPTLFTNTKLNKSIRQSTCRIVQPMPARALLPLLGIYKTHRTKNFSSTILLFAYRGDTRTLICQQNA